MVLKNGLAHQIMMKEEENSITYRRKQKNNWFDKR